MYHEMSILIPAAITIAILHTLAGPDHYLPFIVLAKSRKWSLAKTLTWTIVCGCGHVWSSVLLGLGGAALGWTITHYKWMDNIRGGIAGWAMICFGLGYIIYGMIQLSRNSAHKHFDIAEDGELYVYQHSHSGVVSNQQKHKVTPWVMFIIFLLGPCEPMIPLLYYPGARSSTAFLFILILTYTIATLIVMTSMVAAGYYGFASIKNYKLEKYVPLLGGGIIMACGTGMIFLGW